jgi:hypothetical protein
LKPATLSQNNKYAKFLSPLSILGLLWLCVNGFFLLKDGIISDGESDKYITQANLFIQTGHLDSPNFWLYFTQIALLAFCLKLKIGFWLVIAVQLLLNLFASFYFYKTMDYIFHSKKIALIATALLLLNLPYQEFNHFLQTESLFYSITLILSCYLIKVEKIASRNFLIIVIFLAIVSITRPTGLLFIPPVFAYLFFVYLKKMAPLKKFGLLSAITLFFIFLLNKAIGSGGELDFMLPFRDERIICGVPTLPHFLDIKTTENGNSLYGLLYYITHNFGQFVKMAWLRTVAFFGLFRSYFTTWHNIYLIAFFFPLYIAGIFASPFWIRKNMFKFLYLTLAIALNWLTVILTCDDWHNRFFLSISPYIIIISMGLLIVPTKKQNDRS